MRILLAFVVLLSASSVNAQDRVFRGTLATAVMAHAYDLTSTVDCQARGACVEANPWLMRFKDWKSFTTAKMGLATGTLLATAAIYERCESKKCKWSAVGLNLAQTAAFSAIAVRNARVSR